MNHKYQIELISNNRDFKLQSSTCTILEQFIYFQSTSILYMAISLSAISTIYIGVCLTGTNRILIGCPWAICVMCNKYFHHQKVG